MGCHESQKDAPNYRHASKSEQKAGKTCGTCKAWDSSKTDNPMTGYCKWYDFNCMADHTCDAWVGKKMTAFTAAWSLLKGDPVFSVKTFVICDSK